MAYARADQGGYQGEQNITGSRSISNGSHLFDYYEKREPTPPRRPDGVSIYQLINRASEFTKFLKPFLAVEKKLAVAVKKRDAADTVVVELRITREGLLQKALSE